MIIRFTKGGVPKNVAMALLGIVFSFCFVTKTFSQGTQDVVVYQTPLEQFLEYIQDSLLFGGGKLSEPQYFGVSDGRGLFKNGLDFGLQRGIMLSNGWVMAATTVDGGNNKTGAQASERDSLGPYHGPGGSGLRDSDMDWLAGVLMGENKPDTAVDPSVIMFKFKPYYNSIRMRYVFASEEYKWDGSGGAGGGGGDPDVDLTGAPMSDFMGIFVKRYPSEQVYHMIASLIGTDWHPWGPNKIPVCVKYVNHESLEFEYRANRTVKFIFDGYTKPQTLDLANLPSPVTPCQTYWIKVGVADYPNGIVMQGYDLSHQMNSAVFLEAFSLISGYGLEWTVEGVIDNPDFVSDSALVEGGCSNMIITLKTNILPWDTTYVRLKIDGATPGEYTITPPLYLDSLMVIPDSVMEVTYVISAIDDGIPEGTNGIEKWNIRYQMDPCDVPMPDTSGFGTAHQGYSGEFRVNVYDYNPYVNKTKTYGPLPANIYYCGNDVTVSVSDILEGGIPPYIYTWSHPVVPQIGMGENFTTPISASPDYIYVTITDRCSNKPGYETGKDTVIIYSTLTVQASPDFQLCQNGQSDIKVLNTNVGSNFSTIWYFQGNPVGYDSIYTVTWDEYGSYAPNTLVFTCMITDDCGNIAFDEVNATFFPVVEITGAPLICLGDVIQLICTGAQTYQWYRGSISPGNIIPGATSQVLYYTPATPGFHTICVEILNDCGELADTCYSFEVSKLDCAVQLNSSTNFSVCPNVPFSLSEVNAYGGWTWSWYDAGTPHTATGPTINLSLAQAGNRNFTVIAYNENGCYDTLDFQVTVFPYAQLQAYTQHSSVCLGYPTQLSASPNGPVTATSYYWTSSPVDNSLIPQQFSPAPIVTPQQTTTYQCRILDNHGCYDSATVVVEVRPKIAGNILAYPGSACTGKPVDLNFQAIIPPLTGASYFWTFDGGSPPTSTVPQPSVLWTTAGQKNIQLTISEPGCEETFNLQFTVHPDPLALFSASNNAGCQPVEVSFFNESSNLENPAYLWEFGDGTTSTLPNPTYLYENPGAYNVTLTVTNATGCVNTLTIFNLVEVYEVPVASFTANPQAATIDNPTIRFNELINIPWSIIEWDFGDGASNSGDPNPRHTYGAPGSYMVVMYTETIHGCWDRDTLEIGILEDIKIFVPNAFSPNGDGLNDCFSVGGTTGDVIEVFRVIIYSRWGQQIYESPITDPNCVWDGRDMHGNLVTPDTYIFRIFGKSYKGAKKVYEGLVTVVI